MTLIQLVTFISTLEQAAIIFDAKNSQIVGNSLFDKYKITPDDLKILAATILAKIENSAFHSSCQVNELGLDLDILEVSNKLFLVSFRNTHIKEPEKHYDNLVAAIHRMGEAVVITNTNGLIEFANKTLFTLFPFIEQSQIDSLTLSDLIDQISGQILKGKERKQKAFMRLVKRKLTQNHSLTFSFRNVDQRYIDYRDSISQHGERICLFIDESSIMFLHEQLELAYKESLTLSQAKSSFLAAMSHEVKTPLNAMLGILDLCLADKKLAESEYIKRLDHSGQQLLRLVNDVLDYTKLDAEKMSLNKVTCNLADVFGQVLTNHQAKAHEKSIRLSLSLSDKLPHFASIDDIRLSQILNNLISNSIKFCPQEQGKVELNVEFENDNQLHIEVSDNGMGISEEAQKHIFDSFSQADSQIHRNFGGTGLGLSICKELCELMGGEIKVHSRIGEGCKMRLIIPIQVIESAPVIQAIPKNLAHEELSAKLASVKVLFVEDNPANMFVLKEQSKKLSLDADFAENAKSAIKLWQKKHHQLIISDYQMPEKTGAQLIQIIKALERKKSISGHTKMYVLTADKTLDCEQDCKKSGADAVIMKPLKLQGIADLVSQHVNKSEGFATKIQPINRQLASKAYFDSTALDSIMGETDVSEKVEFLSLFVENMQKSKAELKQAILLNDMKMLREISHRMKSSAKIIGAQKLCMSCEHLERVSREERNNSEVEQTLSSVIQDLNNSLSETSYWVQHAKY